jgi:hypothetical protein
VKRLSNPKLHYDWYLAVWRFRSPHRVMPRENLPNPDANVSLERNFYSVLRAQLRIVAVN